MIGWPIFRFLSYPIAFLLPGYNSFKAVLSDAGDDDTRWLCYWLIYALFYLIETTLSLVVASFPFYYEIKCVLLILLQWDTARLSATVFNNYLYGVLTAIEPRVDDFVNKYSASAIEMAKLAKSRAQKAAAGMAIENMVN